MKRYLLILAALLFLPALALAACDGTDITDCPADTELYPLFDLSIDGCDTCGTELSAIFSSVCADGQVPIAGPASGGFGWRFQCGPLPAAPAAWALESGATGQAPVARLGTGSPNDTHFLRGDGAWETPPTPADWALDTGASGTAPVERLGSGTPTMNEFLRGDGAWAVPTGTGMGLTTQILQVTAGTEAELNPLAADGDANAEHGLGDYPHFINAYIECIDNTGCGNSWAFGDRIQAEETSRLTVGASTTHVYIGIADSAGNTIRYTPRDGGGAQTITLADWKAVAVPYLIQQTDVTGLQGPAGPAGPAGMDATGDITAILTPAESGINLSSCTSGDCTIQFNLNNMQVIGDVGLTPTSRILVDVAGDEFAIYVRSLSNYVFDRIHDLTYVPLLDANDKFPFSDSSDSADAKETDLSDISNFIGNRLAGDNLTYNATTNQLDAMGGGGTPSFSYFVGTPSPINRTATPGTSANVARGDHAHAGTSTNLTDMPATIEARKLLAVNAAGLQYELIDQPRPVDNIPEVSKLPSATAPGAPPAVLLPYNYTEGVQQNATMTVGFDPDGEAGYSDGSLISDTYGSVDVLSPLDALFGAGTAASYSIQVVLSSHEEWINEFTHILIADTEYALGDTFVSLGGYERRIQGNPTGLSHVNFQFNFKRADNTWWFNDGSTVMEDAGLYVQIDDTYEIVTSRGVDHIDGVGEPAFDPTHAAQVYVDDRGDIWVSGDEVQIVGVPPAITFDGFNHSHYLQQATSLVGFESNATDGDFVYFGTGFIQRRGSATTAVTFHQAWEYINGIDPSAANQDLEDRAVFLGSFPNTTDAAEAREQYADANDRYFFLIHSASPQASIILREVSSFTPTTAMSVDHFFWNGPKLNSEDAIDIIGDVIVANPDERPTENLIVLEANGVVYDAEDIVHPDRSSGLLRNPTALDWNAACNCSRNIAWDGSQFLKVERYFEGAHSADAVLTEVALLEDFSHDGVTYRWRGSNDSAGPNINQQLHDFYFWNTRLQFQEWDVDFSGQGNPRWHLRDGPGPLWTAINYVGYGRYQDNALGHVTDNGQRIVYNRQPERARGLVRITGAEDTLIPLGTEFTASGDIRFHTIQEGTIPAAGMIDLKARGIVGGSRENVDDNTVFTLTTAITGVTGLVAEGAFTRGDDISGGRRLFTVSEFEPPDSQSEYQYRWVPMEVSPEDAPRLVWYNRTTGILRDAVAADFDADHGQSSVIAFDGTDLHKVSRREVGASGATGTFTTVADGTATGPNNRWRGTHWQDYLVDSPMDGDVYYNRHEGFRDYDGTNWHNVGTSEVFTTVEFLGAFNTTQQALDFATMDGQWALIEQTSGTPIMQVLSNHMAGTPAHYEYFWVPAVHIPPIPPVPQSAMQDQILRWSQADGHFQPTQIVTGSTITGIGTSGDPLNVDVHDIIEELGENIRWHSDSTTFTTKGATVCNFFRTGPSTYAVTHTRWTLDIPPGEQHHYRARIYTLNEDNNNMLAKLGDSAQRLFSTPGTFNYLYFDTDGVLVPSNTRVAVCISRTVGNNDVATWVNAGQEEASSPDESYEEASEDWVRQGWGEYETLDPQTGNGTRTHADGANEDIYGELGIYYRRIINHGSLVGDDRVDLDHLNDDVTARLLPASPGDNQIAQYNEGNSAWEPVDLPMGGVSDGVANSLAMALNGNDLTVTIGRSLGADLAATQTLPAATGDITGITTDATSGLTGGVATGTADLEIDFERLPDPGTWTVEQNDDYFALYSDDEGTHIKATAFQVARGLAGRGGIGDITSIVTDASSGLNGGANSADVELEIDLKRLALFPTATDAIAGDDIIAVTNESIGGDPTQEITITDFFEDILGDNLTWDATDNQIDATGGAAATTFTALTDTPAAITASECVQGNAAGDALVFAACGTGGGDITAVLGTAPIVVTGGDTGDATVTITAATTAAAGSMSAADKVKLDGLERQIELINSLTNVTYNQNDTADLSTRFGGNAAYVADIDAEGTADAEINDLIVFQWRDNPSSVPLDRALGIRINDTGTTLPIRVVNPITRSLANKTAGDLTRYEFLFLSRQDGVFIQLSALELAPVMARLLPTATDDQIARYDAGTSAWVAEDLPAGAATFTALTDTPTDITANECVKGNGAGDALEFEECGVGTAHANLDTSFPLHANNNNPAGMGWDATNERVLVVDHVDNIMYRYERDGTYIDNFNLNAGNTLARGVTTNATHIFVVDIGTTDRRVYRYQLDGTYVDNWDLQLSHTSPFSITWDGSELNITQATDGSVRRYTADGTHQGNWTLHADNDDPRGFTWTGTQFLVSDHADALVYRYSGTHGFLGTWPQSGGNGDSDGMTFVDGSPYIVDEDDNVYIYAYGGITTFQGLQDTPADFGTAGQHVVVNADADGLAYADAPTGGGGIVKAKYVQADSTARNSISRTTWTDIMSQAVTLSVATDRVYVDTVVNMTVTTGQQDCGIRIVRGTTLLATNAFELEFANEEFSAPLRHIDTPGTGTYTYTVQAQSQDPSDATCNVNDDGHSSFMTLEILAANP